MVVAHILHINNYRVSKIKKKGRKKGTLGPLVETPDRLDPCWHLVLFSAVKRAIIFLFLNNKRSVNKYKTRKKNIPKSPKDGKPSFGPLHDFICIACLKFCWIAGMVPSVGSRGRKEEGGGRKRREWHCGDL